MLRRDEIFKMRSNGLTYRQICEELGVTNHYARTAIQKVRRDILRAHAWKTNPRDRLAKDFGCTWEEVVRMYERVERRKIDEEY